MKLINKIHIVTVPDPILRAICTPITKIDEEIIALSLSLKELATPENVAGIAAPQVGKNIQLIVCKKFVSDDEFRLVEMINPKILKISKALQTFEEGCLSLPGVFYMISRPKKVTVQYTDITGKLRVANLFDFNAQIVQHEIDHLHGVLFIDHVSDVKL